MRGAVITITRDVGQHKDDKYGAHPVNRLRRGEPLTTRSQSLRRRVCNSLWNKGCYWSTEHTRSSSREIRRDRTLRREGQSRVPTQTRPIFSVHATTVVGSPSASGVAGGGATLRVSVKTASSGKLLSHTLCFYTTKYLKTASPFETACACNSLCLQQPVQIRGVIAE